MFHKRLNYAFVEVRAQRARLISAAGFFSFQSIKMKVTTLLKHFCKL